LLFSFVNNVSKRRSVSSARQYPGLLAKLHILLATSLVRVVVSVQPVNGRLDWQSIIIKSLIQRYF
jgi:hypothetical protein